MTGNHNPMSTLQKMSFFAQCGAVDVGATKPLIKLVFFTKSALNCGF